jgi:hypothetical protein
MNDTNTNTENTQEETLTPEQVITNLIGEIDELNEDLCTHQDALKNVVRTLITVKNAVSLIFEGYASDYKSTDGAVVFLKGIDSIVEDSLMDLENTIDLEELLLDEGCNCGLCSDEEDDTCPECGGELVEEVTDELKE